MDDVQKYFEETGYIVLENVMPPDVCNKFVDHMFDLHKRGKLSSDGQCPLSDSIYNDEIFKNALVGLSEPVSNIVGKKLLPSYTYARIYRTGEVLEPHVDRPACEVSITLTLGYKAENIWPIFFDEEKRISVVIDVGSAVVYKGCIITHWREVFQGEWQVQLFLHYVDAHGPYASHAYDLIHSHTVRYK